MSRPPRPYPNTEVSAGLPIKDGRLQVFAPTYQDLVDVETNLSLAELGQLSPGGEGDFASTLFGLSAAVGHVLGVYQDFYGGEAFVGTARTEQSLVRHGRRVGYTTDPGVAATGVISIDIKPGLSGDLPSALPLLSVPKGELGTESYETFEVRHVDSNWNSIEIVGPTTPLPRISLGALANGPYQFVVDESGLGILPGEFVVLAPKDGSTTQFAPIVLTVNSADDNGQSTTTLELQAVSEISPAHRQLAVERSDLRLLAKPDLELRLFGWNADARIFPPKELQESGAFHPPLVGPAHDDPRIPPDLGTSTIASDASYGYQVFTPDLVNDPNDTAVEYRKTLYLAEALHEDIEGQWVARLQEGISAPQPFFVTHQGSVSLSFIREEIQLTVVKLSDTTTMYSEQHVPQWISGTTTGIRVSQWPLTNGDVDRDAHDSRSRWLADWKLDLNLVTAEANPEEIATAKTLELMGDLGGLEPGMLIVFSNKSGSAAQLVELTSVTTEVPEGEESAQTTIEWRERGPRPATALTKGDLVVLGNVVRVSHGKTAREVLGDSDGVTPFIRFSLKKSPLTHLPGATGAEPALEVRVNDVLWTRVDDFTQSGSEDRHYIVQRDESQVSQVVFGDGRKGAIPGSGQRNVQATYRVGLGRIGNVDAGRLSRLEKAHPLIQIVRNPLPISGGTEPAALNQIRLESTRFIRTFDRAVSASDYADLALLFPGVARSQATSTPNSAVVLVVADADGHALGDNTAFLSFINARRDRGVRLELKDPVEVQFYLHVRIEFDSAFFDWQVDRAVRDMLSGTDESAPGLFTFRGRQMGEAAFLSRVYQAIQLAPGVVFSQIIHFDLKSEDVAGASIVRDSIRVATQEWLSLPPNNLIIDTSSRSDV